MNDNKKKIKIMIIKCIMSFLQRQIIFFIYLIWDNFDASGQFRYFDNFIISGALS